MERKLLAQGSRAQLLVLEKVYKMSIHLKDCHIVLSVKSNFENNKNLFVSSFSGFVLVGIVKNLNFTEKRLQIPVKKFSKFRLEIENLISFLLSNIEASGPQQSCFGNYSWKGQTGSTESTKTVSYYQSELLLLTIDIDELSSITSCFSKVAFYSFLFKDLEILFFGTILQDCSRGLSLESLQTNEVTLANYIANFSARNRELTSINTIAILKNLFFYYIKEIEVILTFDEAKPKNRE